MQRFVKAPPGSISAVSIHGRRASTPFGPAAGPHTQMAQNIVLSWLAGGRVIECKTVQIKDDLVVPRPCIDMQTVGFNVEWSQELTLDQSLEEYVKASMLIEMLKASGVGAGFGDTVFDMSVGYDLAGIRSAKVRAFLDGMMDARPVVERLRGQIPAAWAQFRDLPFATRISDTLTLSTFHGCPPGEIEEIARFLLGEVGLDVVVKLNPTLLGREELTDILHDRLGYSEIWVPDAAFDKDAKWDAGRRVRRAPGRRSRLPRARLRGQVLQHAGGREPQELLPGERKGDVSVRPAAASAGHRAGRAGSASAFGDAFRSRSRPVSTRPISPMRWRWA